MNDCIWLSDRMPAVALGRAEWTPDEVHHLSNCASCQREWEVVQATRRLGQGLLHSDYGPTATAVLHRLERESGPIRFRLRAATLAALAAAAAIVGLVWTGVPGTPPDSNVPTAPVMAGRLEIRLPELESLQPVELDSVLRTMDESAGDSTVEEPGLAELDSDELQQVLESWEG